MLEPKAVFGLLKMNPKTDTFIWKYFDKTICFDKVEKSNF
jgi:hypothetical protein